MPAKFLSAEEAAARLGVSVDELKEMRENGEIHALRDGGMWKFKPEEVERVANERLDGGGQIELEGGSGVGDSVLLRDEFLASGSSPSKIIGDDPEGGGSAADSDLRLISSAGGGSDVGLLADAGEPQLSAQDSGLGDDVTLDLRVGAPAEPDAEADEMALPDDVRYGSSLALGDDHTFDDVFRLSGQEGQNLSAQSGGSDVTLHDAGAAGSGLGESGIELGGGSGFGGAAASGIDLSGSAVSRGSDLNLGSGVDDDVRMAESGVGSNVDLTLEEDDMVLGGSGAGSDVTLGSGDSGINLRPADSGISLEDEPLDLGGSAIEELELPEDEEMIALDDQAADPDAATQLKTDDQFTLTPVEADGDDEESGSQVIALEDSEAFDQNAATLLGGGQQALVADDADLFGGGQVGLGGGMGAQPLAMPAGMVPPAALPETPYSIWNVLFLLVVFLFLAVGSVMMIDLVRTMWAHEGDMAVSTSLMDQIVQACGFTK